MKPRRLSPSLRERIRSLPDKPGVYFFKNRDKKPLYIGKALSIRKRVMGHFRNFGESFSKEAAMLAEISFIDFVETPTEGEALLLEASLVKQALPKYNQELRDDKSYPFLKITDEEFPRLLIVRGRKADGGRYFGPYTNVRLLRQAVGMLRWLFPMRTCHPFAEKLCLMYHIGQCKGPCERLISKGAYAGMVKELGLFLEGRRDALVRNLFRRMKEHARLREYEKAQSVYEEIKALSIVPQPDILKKDARQVLNDLNEALNLPHRPARIEGFDISNIAGKEAVGSMVVFVDGKPSRSEYRRFRIRTVRGIDDYQMMQEVIRRRYARALEEKQPLPDLAVIDGGKGHLASAKKVLEALGLSDLPVISIAKQHEHIFKPGREAPYIFPQSSPILHLLQNLRNEAHRFAIAYHRRLHKREALVSRLDAIHGVGPKTKEKLLKKVGSVVKIRTLSPIELAKKAHLSQKTAQNILTALEAVC